MFSPEPLQTSSDQFFAVFCGPGPWFFGSENFWDQTGPQSVQKRAQDWDRTETLSTIYKEYTGTIQNQSEPVFLIGLDQSFFPLKAWTATESLVFSSLSPVFFQFIGPDFKTLDEPQP